MTDTILPNSTCSASPATCTSPTTCASPTTCVTPTTVSTTTTTTTNASPSPPSAGDQKRRLSYPLAAAFLVLEMSGSGVLALPKALANTGWAGLAVMVVLCCGVGYAGTRLALCWTLLEEKHSEYRTPNRRPYPTIALRALGRPGHYLATAAQQITLLGVCTVYILLSAQLLSALMAPVVPRLTLCVCIVTVGIVLMPATWMGTPQDFWPASIAAIVITVVECVVVVVELARSSSSLPPPVYPSPSFRSFFMGFGTMVFSFGGAATFPTVQNDMADRGKFVYSVMVAFAVLLMLYAPVASAGYGVLGDRVTNNILLSVSGVAVTVVRSLIFTHLLFAFVVLFNPVAQGLEEVLKVPRDFGWRRCVVRAGVLGAMVVTALLVPDFGKILNLIGGSTVTLESFVLPPLCYLSLCLRDPASQRSVSSVEVVVLSGVVVAGVTAGVVTTYTAASAITAKGALSLTCFS